MPLTTTPTCDNADKTLLACLVNTSPGKWSITEALNPVPTFVGQEVRKPYFSLNAISSFSSIKSSISSAILKASNKSNPGKIACILK